jgi:EmrB/QacA subfamily drug resistance transporter
VTTRPRSGPILAIILTSYFMILLDNSVIFTGLPSIRSELGLSATELSWVQDAYTLVFGGLLLLGARAGDLIGRRRLFVIGLAIFTTASFLVGAAPAGWWLIAARALQGIGAAVVAPTSLSLLTANFPEGRERTRAVGWYGATAGIGASLGLVVGGACADWISWRAGFFINLPVGLALVLAARRFLGETERRTGRFDTVGALTATLGVGAIVFGIVNSADAGWGSLTTVAALVGGVVLLVVLVANEWRAEQPIMPLRLFRSRERSGAYAARLLFLGAMIGFFYFTTQYLQGVLGFSPLQAGLGFFPMTVVNFAVAIAVPRLTRRFGNAMLLAAGMAVTLAGMAWLSRLHTGDAYQHLPPVGQRSRPGPPGRHLRERDHSHDSRHYSPHRQRCPAGRGATHHPHYPTSEDRPWQPRHNSSSATSPRSSSRSRTTCSSVTSGPAPNSPHATAA